ncbi:MAG: hypothetical protein IIA45_12245 [Bacteroidetes bacterium]|nr:hypothetical protein [Bacteroidota bacterium]
MKIRILSVSAMILMLVFLFSNLTTAQENTDEIKTDEIKIDEIKDAQEELVQDQILAPDEDETEADILTAEVVAAVVTSYIKKSSEKNKGYFMVEDRVNSNTLKLKMKKVHDDELRSVGNRLYSICVDFESRDGTKYDIDMLLGGDTKENIKTMHMLVHIDGGTERFTWNETDGLWKATPK